MLPKLFSLFKGVCMSVCIEGFSFGPTDVTRSTATSGAIYIKVFSVMHAHQDE